MNVIIFYYSLIVISVIFSVIYIYMWHKHFNSCFTIIFTLVPISCLGYAFYANATTLEGSLTAIKITYIGGCFLQLFIVLSIFSLCGISIPRLVRTAMFAVCAACYGSVLTTEHTGIFYKKVSFEMQGGHGVLIRTYGPMHTVFYIILCTLFMVGFAVIIYSWFKKEQVPRGMLILLIVPDAICILSFFIVKGLLSYVDVVPVGYCIAELVFLLIAYRVNLYDISDTVIDSMVHEWNIGYASFDFRYRYLGSNGIAKSLIPVLNDLAVDQKLGFGVKEKKLRGYLDAFKSNPQDNNFELHIPDPDGDPEKDRYYKVSVNDLYDGRRKRGYIVAFSDDTANKKYINLLDGYNAKLQTEVNEKTRHIVEMHDNLIMSLAMMVESRDNSTGGHIKRTSEGVRILIREIRRDGTLSLSDEFCRDVVKAAPMHDLGKIAVDDAVLRKPGRFTPEEYEKMKQHSAEGARVIHEILRNTDDESFKIIAENVAHYHHERWDGKGYPEHLSGEAIPIEARIMAIADVYDALVSKRVYKEAFDYQKADSIIMEGMGTQFDPGLKHIYEMSRPYLEEYYESV